MLPHSCSSILCVLASYSVLLGLSCPVISRAQSTPVSKLNLRAALVLTPEFCATQIKKGKWMSNQERFDVGKAVCSELGPALKDVLTEVTSVDATAAAGDAQIILVPRFIDVTATQAKIAFSNRELVLLVEWTAKDRSGKTLWLETVQGSAKHHIGNTFTYKKNLKLIVKDSSKDLAAQSADRISASAQLRHLAQAGEATQAGQN